MYDVLVMYEANLLLMCQRKKLKAQQVIAY